MSVKIEIHLPYDFEIITLTFLFFDLAFPKNIQEEFSKSPAPVYQEYYDATAINPDKTDHHYVQHSNNNYYHDYFNY